MPAISSDVLDDQILLAGATSFSGGMDSFADPASLRPDQLASVTNMDIDRTGFICTRGGTSLMMNILGYSNSIQLLSNYVDGLGLSWLIWMNAGAVYKYDGFHTAISSNYLQVFPSFLVNSASTQIFPSSAAKQIQAATIGSTVFLSEGVAGGPLRFYLHDGASNSSINNGVNSNGVKFNVKSSTNSYESGFPLNAGFYLLASQSGRIWGVRLSQPDRLYYSKLLPTYDSSDSWMEAANIRIGDDGLPITAISSWTGNRLVVFKQNSTYVINVDPLLVPANTGLALVGGYFPIEKVSGEVGCAASRSVVQIGSNLFWLANDGVRTMARTLAGSEQEISEPISRPINSEILKINPSEIQFAAAAYYKNRYFLSFASGTADRNNTTIVYNVLKQSWAGRWTNWFCADAFCVYKPRKTGRKEMLYLATNLFLGEGTTANSRRCFLQRWIDDPSGFSGYAYSDFDITTDYAWAMGSAREWNGIPSSLQVYAYNLVQQQGGSLATGGTIFTSKSDQNGNYLGHFDSPNNQIRKNANANYFEIYDNALGRIVYKNSSLTFSGFFAVDGNGQPLAGAPVPTLVPSTLVYRRPDYPSSFTTKQFDFDAPINPKTINNLDVVFGSSEAKISSAICDTDGNENYVIRNESSSSLGSGTRLPVLGIDSQTINDVTSYGIFLPFYLYKPTSKKISRSVLTSSGSRGYSARVEAGSGKMEVRSVILTAFEDTFSPEGA